MTFSSFRTDVDIGCRFEIENGFGKYDQALLKGSFLGHPIYDKV
jgi:hypothetical protein